jgi:hypothetical protein
MKAMVRNPRLVSKEWLCEKDSGRNASLLEVKKTIGREPIPLFRGFRSHKWNVPGGLPCEALADFGFVIRVARTEIIVGEKRTSCTHSHNMWIELTTLRRDADYVALHHDTVQLEIPCFVRVHRNGDLQHAIGKGCLARRTYRTLKTFAALRFTVF